MDRVGEVGTAVDHRLVKWRQPQLLERIESANAEAISGRPAVCACQLPSVAPARLPVGSGSTELACQQMGADLRRLREKLRDAADAVTLEGQPLKEGLRRAYLYGLSGLRAEDFPDADARAEFMEVTAALTATGETQEGLGSATTTFAVDDAEAKRLAGRIVALADRYEAHGWRAD